MIDFLEITGKKIDMKYDNGVILNVIKTNAKERLFIGVDESNPSLKSWRRTTLRRYKKNKIC